MSRGTSTGVLAAACLVLAGTGELAAQARPVLKVDQAMALSQRTGKPILTIAGTTN